MPRLRKELCHRTEVTPPVPPGWYWDKPTKRAKFGDFMDQVESRGYVSAYHHHRECERGTESDPTLW